MTAEELVKQIRESDGRIYRMIQQPLVFVLTGNEALAAWLVDLGGKPFRPPYLPSFDYGVHGGYRRAQRGALNWDIYVHMIPVEGEQTIWEAVGPPNLSTKQVQAVTAE